MDNPDNINNPLNQNPNPGMFSPNKGSPMKIPGVSKTNNPFLFSQSPYPIKGPLFNTPNKSFEGRGFFAFNAETPFNMNMNNIAIPISPLNNNQKTDIPFQNSQNKPKNYQNYFISPNFTDKK